MHTFFHPDIIKWSFHQSMRLAGWIYGHPETAVTYGFLASMGILCAAAVFSTVLLVLKQGKK